MNLEMENSVTIKTEQKKKLGKRATSGKVQLRLRPFSPPLPTKRTPIELPSFLFSTEFYRVFCSKKMVFACLLLLLLLNGCSLSFPGFYLVLPSFTGFYLVLPGFTGFYLVLPGFTGFYLVLQTFPGFYLVLPSFTELSWVLLGFT